MELCWKQETEPISHFPVAIKSHHMGEKKWKNERESFLKSSFRSAFEIQEVKDIICP